MPPTIRTITSRSLLQTIFRRNRLERTTKPFSTMPPPTYITAEKLIEKLRTDKPPKVIDVREEDRKGGHIKHSIHIPAPVFRASPSQAIPLVKDAELVVVHCMYSQVRGPSCAALLAAALDSAVAKKEVEGNPQVTVLEGGFAGMLRNREGNEDLFQEFDGRYHF